MCWFRRLLSRLFRSRPRDPKPTARRPRSALGLESLDSRDVPAVLNYGGNVLPHVEAQAVFYGSEWSTPASGQPTPATLDASLADLVGGSYMDALTRAGYGVGRGTDSAGAIDPVSLARGSVITDASIQSRLLADIAAGRVQQPDANRLYVVYVQPDVAVNLGAGQGTTQQGILGYHGAFAGPNGTTVRYAVVAYPGGAAGNSSLGRPAVDQLTAVASHEVAEAVTDPDVNYARLGWYDPARGEIGDITENNPNALVRLDGFLVQLVSDRNDQLLTLAAPTPPPTPSPSPTPTHTATTTTLTASPVWYTWSGAYVTLTARVTAADGSVPNGGTVYLTYNGSVIGSGTVHVVNGVAEVSFNVRFTYHGIYTFGVQYSGTSQYLGGTGNNVTVVV